MVDKTAAAMGNIPESLLGKAVNAEGASEVGEGFSKLMKGGASKAGGEADKIAGKLSGELSGAEKGHDASPRSRQGRRCCHGHHLQRWEEQGRLCIGRRGIIIELIFDYLT